MPNDFLEKKAQLEALKNGSGVRYLLQEGYKIFGNPMAVFDTSYNLLLHIEEVVTDDPLWNELISLGGFSHETVDFFNEVEFIKVSALADTVAYMKSDKLKYDRMNGKLFDKDNVQLGNIILVACMKDFEEGDWELLELLCEMFSVELQNSEFYQKIDRVYQESLIGDLIEGNIQDRQSAKTTLQELYGELEPWTHLYLAVVDIIQYEHTLTHLAYFRDLFRKIQPEHRYYIHQNHIVILIGSENPALNIGKDLGFLNEFFVKYKIYAGVSSGFTDLLELRKYYREAICTLNHGLKTGRERHIFRHDNVSIEHFLISVKTTAGIRQICSPIAFAIQEYDRENDTSLLELLYTYLAHGKDSRLTCEKMKIARGTLNRRLKKLEDIFGLEWKNGEMLSNIFISLKMLDCFPA